MARIRIAELGKPIKKDIEVKQGDSFSWEITGSNLDASPYDFTGHTFLMQVKDISTSPISVIAISGADITISADSDGQTAGVSNVITLAKLPADMDVFPKEYVYDLQQTDAGGSVQTIYEGKFLVTQDVSRVEA